MIKNEIIDDLFESIFNEIDNIKLNNYLIKE